jgi:diketogulonate reductase-like aldo/keto reductase
MSKTVSLPDGSIVPALGQGTWRMGERADRRRAEIIALQAGIEAGLTLIDTAEMYGDGRTELLLSEALKGYRQDVYLVSKVYPHHATADGVVEACERSLQRLRTDRLDLYLLHWRGAVPLQETLEGFSRLVEAGKIRHWGVSNFDSGDMAELMALPGGGACAANQILYNLMRRGPECDLLPGLLDRGIAAMAYSPIEQGQIPRSDALSAIARLHGRTTYQIALAFVLRRPGIIAIPKAGKIEHVRENLAALEIELSSEDLTRLDAAFPPPKRKRPLEML